MNAAGPAPHPGLLQRTGAEALRQQLRLQDDFVSRNSPDIPIREQLTAVGEFEYIVRTFITEICSGIGVDLAHHQVDLFLRILPDINTFRNNPADQLVIVLTGTFLIGSTGIAVEHT